MLVVILIMDDSFMIILTLLIAIFKRKFNRRRKRLITKSKLIYLRKTFSSKLKNNTRWKKLVNHQKFWEKDEPLWPEHHFQKVFRVTRESFSKIVKSVEFDMAKEDTPFKTTIPIRKRVAIAIYYLKSGANFDVVGLTFGVGKSTVCNIVDDFFSALIKNNFHEQIHFPTTNIEMATMEQDFNKRWQFPGVIGAIDGSHIKAPKHHGPDYHNYKGWCSTILLGVVDFKYRYLS